MGTATFSSEVDEVMSAVTATDLFGTNRARARIRYHRLARAVHPDADGGSQEAMARLNALWDEYDTGKPATPVGRKPSEMTRNARYAVFRDGGNLLVVDRMVGDSPSDVTCRDFNDVSGTSPVRALELVDSKVIAQPDGTHAAYECRHDPALGTMLSMDDLKGRLPNGTMHPADLAWIAKRAIHLGSIVGKCGVRFACEPSDCIAVSPREHMLVVMAPWELVKSSDMSVSDQRGVLKSFCECVRPVIRDDWQSRRLRRFLEGCVMDMVTESTTLMDEYNDLLVELFGGFHFHEMEVSL